MSTSDLDGMLDGAWTIRQERFAPVVHLFVPSMKRYQTGEYSCASASDFVPVSVTGGRCQLGCDHCKGELLGTMKPALTAGALWELAERLAGRGCNGILLSGGSDRQGHVPLLPYMETVGRIRRELGLKVVVHTGLVTEELAGALGDAGVECAMLDVMGDAETIRSVYHLDVEPRAMARSLEILHGSGVRTVPHVVVGLHHGRILGEREALAMIADTGPAAVVLVVLNPLGATPMAGATPPTPEDVAALMVEARTRMPETPLLMGCARPGGPYRAETDRYALRAGFNGIAYPADGTAGLAREMGLEPAFARECCALVIDLI